MARLTEIHRQQPSTFEDRGLIVGAVPMGGTS
jgi:hypothetical protein